MFPTERLLEFAYAAYRINNGYVKDSLYEISKDGAAPKKTFSNKEIVLYSTIKEFSPKTYCPSDFVPVEVTEQDRENVKIAQEHFKRYTMLSLGSDLNSFQRSVYSVISQDTVDTTGKAGILAAVPTMIKNEKAESSYLRRLKKDFAKSQHYNLKQAVSGSIEILKRIHLKEYSIYLYFAGINENLIIFTNRNEYNVGDVHTITGKVKSLENQKETGIKMTKLHYVKLKAIEVTHAD